MSTDQPSIVVPTVNHTPSATKPTPVGATVAIFGASGDLTARKLMPALYDLWNDGYLDDQSPIVGIARREKSDDDYRREIYDAVNGHVRAGQIPPDRWAKFARRLFYRQHDIDRPAGYPQLKAELERIEQQGGTPPNRIVYMATTPELFQPAADALASSGFVPTRGSAHWFRMVFEKPFGHDLASAQELTANLRRILREDQIYRIDHYLGKDTVQNILLFRCGNAIFEPLFNRSHVDHVQITVAESQGMERGRGGYYDKSGALRDVLQNHVLQLMCLVAMEPPALFGAEDLRTEKLKVLKALAPGHRSNLSKWCVSGQYTAAEASRDAEWSAQRNAALRSEDSASRLTGDVAPGYLQEDRIPPDSRTETYVAMKVLIDNWRWAGVPFYLRTGKRLPTRVTEIAIQFKLPPLNLFSTVECEGDICDLVGARPNLLVFRIQPSESISLSFSTKRPGMQYQIHPVTMDFCYDKAFPQKLPEAYERLLLDVMRGDSTLFMRSDELEAAWQFVTPVLEQWEREHTQPQGYPASTWGPAAADHLLWTDGRAWRTP